MLFEILSSVVVGGLVGCSYLYQQGLGGNDSRNISRIASNAGLVAKDGTKIRILRRRAYKDHVEYVFQLPQGLSVKQFREKIDRFQDGLNAKKRVLDISAADIRNINWKKDFVCQLQELMTKKRNLRKEIEIEFDGTLKFRVYTEELTSRFDYDLTLLESTKGWKVPIGISRKGLVFHDFEKEYNLIVAGSPGYGKTVFLKNAITTFVAKQTRNVNFFLIDLKGGLAFNRFKGLEQVRGLAKNPLEALMILTEAQKKMNERIEYLLQNGFEDVTESGFPERYFVVIDEAADIVHVRECQEIIEDIARRGRGAGFRLVYCTQYPSNQAISSQVRQTVNAQLCFRLRTEAASRAVLDEGGAELLPRIQGRAIYWSDERKTVQTPYISNEFINDTIHPNITFKARKEDNNAEKQYEANSSGKYTLELEETPLS
ncbi:FtsK/SpoIIIE domain-containing protein [Niallia taxi]|uniref:Cell division protein FtsK n=1 Tax=Niallia taxi TaxID=2499688 RepID=A0A3S2TXB8_9BACI|nr:FtsK/SpoIIIE domain-containing protein [Niallia taxi]RVT62777.1 cell division protein FtsK [Niallia taxi]